MAVIRCKACGRVYDYNKQGMCPKCGAYNRPPCRERVDPDGSVHFVESRDAAVPSHRGKDLLRGADPPRRPRGCRGAGQHSRLGLGKPEGQRPGLEK